MPTNLPNILTLSRIGAIPLLIATFYVQGPLGNWLGLGILAFAIGILSAMSFNSLENWHPLNFSIFEGQNFFSIVDIFTGKILLPLSAFLVSVFVGWIADKRLTDDENGISGGLHLTWRFLIAWLCPIAVGAILVFGLIS